MTIIDDLGAIIIIAFFYTAELSLIALMLAGVGVVALALLNVLGVSHRGAFLLVGVFVWVCVLKSGVHATLAGVVTGLAVPLRSTDGSSPAHDLEHDLHPWVAFGVLPAFAFTNAGVGLADIAPAALLEPVQLGTGLRLFFGSNWGLSDRSGRRRGPGLGHFQKEPTGASSTAWPC